jgi:hypothetical protein
MVIAEIDSINDKFFQECISSVNALIDLKVQLHQNEKLIEDQI